MRVIATTVEVESVVIKASDFDWLCEQAEILERIQAEAKESDIVFPTNGYIAVSRDEFAKSAMQGMLAYGQINIRDDTESFEFIAKAAYMQADAMLKEREK